MDKVEWNYGNKTVGLVIDSDYDKPTIFNDYKTFFSKLIEIAEIAFESSLPSDHEFADEQKEKFDVYDLVNSNLTEYEANLKKLGWK